MAQTPENKVKNTVKKQLLSLPGCYFFFPATGGYGSSGVPDIVGCYNGRFFAFECKAGKNTPTDLQEANIARIRAAEGAALVVNEQNALFVAEYLRGFVDSETKGD